MSASVILATAGYGSIRLWQATSAQCRQSIQHADSQVNRLDITSDKQMLAAAGNPMVRIFDVASLSQNQNPVRTLSGHKGNVTTIAFQKQARWMFSGSEDGLIKIWDIRAGGCQRSFSIGASISDAILHPNQGEIVTVDDTGYLRIYDLAAGKCSLSMVVEDRTSLRSLSMASDASMIAAGNNKGKCMVWSVSPQHELELAHSINAHSTYLLKCLISPDNKYLATTSADRSVRIWNLSHGIELGRTLYGHQGWVWDCTFSADSAYLVSASSDKTARLFDLGTGDVVLEYRGHAKAVTCVALNDSPTLH